MKISLYSKFVFYTIGAIVVSFFLAFLLVNTFYHQYLKDKNDAKNIGVAHDIATYIETHSDTDAMEYLGSIADSGYKIYLTDGENQSHFFGKEFREENLSESNIDQVLEGNDYHGMRDLPKETFVTGFFSDELANTAGVPLLINEEEYALFIRPDIKFLFQEVHYLLGGLFAGMALISILFMLFVARNLIKPISKLTKATKQVGEEKFAIDLPVNRVDEIGQLANSFQAMTKQLEESDQMRKQFINDVSHDFQSPLQNIKGYAALIQEPETSEADRTYYGEVIQTESNRLSSLTKQLLLLTSLDSLTENNEMKTVAIDQQIKTVLQGARWQIEEKNIAVSLEIEEAEITGNEGFLEKIWENLLSNAIKYTEPGGMIDMQLSNEEDQIRFIIKDTGIGMDSDTSSHIFDRFYRADAARHTAIAGTGLGLSIVKEVVELHGGRISVDSNPDEGTTFTIILPK